MSCIKTMIVNELSTQLTFYKQQFKQSVHFVKNLRILCFGKIKIKKWMLLDSRTLLVAMGPLLVGSYGVTTSW